LLPGDQSQRTAKAIAWIRANYAKALSVEDLAESAGMGVSTLHHHFRALAAMSPLQYQKRLRAARERMLVAGLDAASAAFEVGYTSPSQFNREYKRFFGQPPMRDVTTRRVAGVHCNGRVRDGALETQRKSFFTPFRSKVTTPIECPRIVILFNVASSGDLVYKERRRKWQPLK